MGGDLKKWAGSELATPPNVEFTRKGGWFLTTKSALLLGCLVVLAILLTALLTKHYTELHLEKTDSGNQSLLNGYPETSVTFHPLSCDLLFNHSSDSFNGDMTLVFKVVKDTEKIGLRFSGQEVSSPSLECMDNEKNATNITISSLDYTRENSSISLVTEDQLSEGMKCSLKLEFQGIINAEEKGVFKVAYKVPKNGGAFEDRWIIGANLAPNYCTRVFPCAEEEYHRTIFRVKLLRQENFSSVSNIFQKAVREMPDNEHYVVDDYEWTPPIQASSLGYFILPDYKVKTLLVNSPLAFNIWYPPHLENTTTPLAQTTTSLLEFYKEYFEVDIPVQRVSLVIVDGLVSDQPAKLGLIPISASLLYSEEKTTPENEEKLYYYLGQKLCNLWIGNMVSFKSSSGNWIQDGLALYFADVAASKTFADYDTTAFMRIVQEKALHEELLNRAQPVSDGDLKMNNYSKYKAAYIINMVADAIDQSDRSLFKKGIQSFLQKWMFNSTEPKALWESLNTVQQQIDTQEFFNSWNKSFNPIVNVKIADGDMTIEQVESSKLWKIPIYYTTKQSFDIENTSMKEEKSIHLKVEPEDSWVIVNPNRLGFYQTNYSLELWSRITNELLKGDVLFPSIVKSGLLDDSFSLAALNMLDYEVPLNLSLYLKNETDLSPWQTAMYHLDFLSVFLDEPVDSENFKVYIGHLINSSLDEINNFEPTMLKSNEKTLQIELNRWACKYNISQDCRLLDPIVNNVKNIKTKIIEEIFSPVYKNSDLSEAEKYLYCYFVRKNIINISLEEIQSLSRMNIPEPYTEMNLLKSLTCTSDTGFFLKIVLINALNTSDPFFSPKRAMEMWLSLKQNPFSSRAAFNYLKDNWSSIYNKFKRESAILDAILEGATFALKEENDLIEVRKLQKIIPAEDIGNAEVLKRIIRQVYYNVEWKKNHLNQVKQWLQYFNNNKEEFLMV